MHVLPSNNRAKSAASVYFCIMKAHILQHVPFEGPGYIATWLAAHNYTQSCTRFYEADYQLPEPESVDVLVVMGGPMGVYDDAVYPWLTAEKAFIASVIAAGKKVLGICLGAQLIAVCTGGTVDKAPVKEIGWFPVQATQQSPGWWKELVKTVPAFFHWHGDKFTIPEKATDLAYSAANTRQAFLLGDNVLGLQFHAEVTPADVAEMLAHGKAELQKAAFIQEGRDILAATNHTVAVNRMLEALLDRLLVTKSVS